jgi:hypothetical protein
MMHPAQAPHHHTRFYIVLVTLVVGSIFFLLVMNDKTNDFGLTGSTVGLFEDGSAVELENPDELFVDSEEKLQQLRSREVNVAVQFNKVPIVKKETTVKILEASFSSPRIPIKINDNFLELSDSEEILIHLEDFEGELNFDNLDLSLDGVANRVKVNGITFSAKNKISILLDDASYNYLFVDEIELKELNLPNGDGELSVSEKLSYSLEQEGLNFYSFMGRITIDESSENLLDMEGVAKGIDVSGALLNLDVR